MTVSGSPTIVVVASATDAHAQHVLGVAASRQLDAVIWDASGYPESATITMDPDARLAGARVRLAPDHSVGTIAGIWWRRPQGARDSQRATIKPYVRNESEVVIRSLPDFLPLTNWVSHPEATRLASRKPVQLAVARNAGFRIPQTCISNDPNDVSQFMTTLAAKGRQVTMKPVGSAFMALSDRGPDDPAGNYVVFTRVVDPDVILENLAMVRNCPVIFQEVVPKDFDVRVTVVDESVFAACVVLEGCEDPDNLDWRNHDGQRVYSRHELPGDLRRRCVALLKRLGLRFGCIDLAFSAADGYTFFEVNPQGQWLPSETKLGYPIADALLDALTRTHS